MYCLHCALLNGCTMYTRFQFAHLTTGNQVQIVHSHVGKVKNRHFALLALALRTWYDLVKISWVTIPLICDPMTGKTSFLVTNCCLNMKQNKRPTFNQCRRLFCAQMTLFTFVDPKSITSGSLGPPPHQFL